MNPKRLTNNQQTDNNGLKTRLFNNAENNDPHPNTINNYNIINAAELNLDLLPKKMKSVNNCRPNTNRTNDSVAAAKSFDRNKAREHIAEQQRKRSLEKKAVGTDGQKEEIKKRLAALHKNSLKIVKKNVAKKQKDMCTLMDSTEIVDKPAGTSEPTILTKSVNKLTTPDKSQASKLQTISEAQPTEPTTVDATPSKRGILRRKELFDGPPTSHSPPRLDKTFINSLLQTVRQRYSSPDEHHESSGDSHNDATPPRMDEKMKLRVPQSELKSKALSRNSSKSRSKSWDLTRTSNSTSKRSGTTKPRNDSKHNIPFWLKPTSTQTYPYNFIMAVRKKLESVTQPVLVDPLPTSETPLARPKNSRSSYFNPTNFRQNLDKAEDSNVAHLSSKTFLNMIDSIPALKSKHERPDDRVEEKTESHEPEPPKTKHVSGSEEFSTNFSSISLHITDRNTMSELSSIRSEQPNRTISPLKISQQHIDLASDCDDTTISSAILSQQNSPEKRSKPHSFIAAPLSTEAIQNLKIGSSKSNLSSQRTEETPRPHPFVNTQRGDSDGNRLSKDLDQRSMVEMFETFSKNLSQVISVNERLHSALSTSFHSSKPATEQRNDSAETKNTLPSQNHSLQHRKTDSDPVYTTSFETTNDESIQEADGIDSRSKTATDLPSRSHEGSEETVKDASATKTVSEPKTGSVVVTTTIDTQTVTSRKTEVLSNVAANDSVRNIDPEFRRYSTASSIIGSDIFAVFSQSDEENSLRGINVSCEESFNYSSIGMIDQLINNEKQKSEHLSKLMKIREKSLIDRTKGQIAWLELQKQKYKEKGLNDRISAVKKKQRALLMHMAAERSNILRLSKMQQSPKSQRSSSKFKFQNFTAADVNVKRSSVGNELNNITQRSAFRAYEINGTQGLEDILRKREEELHKRRNHVEYLIRWHQRLNREESDLMDMERILKEYTSGSTMNPPPPSNDQMCDNSPSKSPRKVPQEMKKIKNIEKSLQLLQNMSSTSVTTNGDEIEDVVEASGNRLNKLWRRLTGDGTDKFNADQQYKLNKFDLEKMYEDAKNVVIVKFTKNKNIGPLNDLSLSVSVLQASTEQNSILQEDSSHMVHLETDELSQSSVIPSLNLNFSRESKTNSIIETNVEATEGNDNYYFTDIQSPTAGNSKSADTIDDHKPLTESDQDNTRADSISLDNNASLSESSYNELIDEISFPNLKDVTSVDQSTMLNNTNCESSSVNDSISTKVQQLTSPSDAIISVNVMAQEFSDNNLSDEYEQDNTTDKSLQLKNSSSDDEAKSVTKSNQTMERSEQVVVESSDNASNSSSSSSIRDEVKSVGLEQRLIDLDDSMKDLSEAIDRAPVMEISQADHLTDDVGYNVGIDDDDEKCDYNEVKMVRNKNINESFPTSDMLNAGKHDELYHGSGKNGAIIRDYVSPTSELKMPDIISEAEVLRRQQLNIEQEIKHLDQTVPAVFPREIPNKPPPPYVPPAHGSPLNAIHPTDERIQEIVYRRIDELYHSISDPATVTEKSQSILSENITNVYERIILDVCKECITELDIHDPSTVNNTKFKQRLAFYNPPNRLEYVQDFALKKVKKLLDPNSACMGTATQIGACVKRKRDPVDEMLVLEMIEDDSKWSNFDLEEKEVIENIVEQIVLLVVNEAVDDAAIWRTAKTSVLKRC